MIDPSLPLYRFVVKIIFAIFLVDLQFGIDFGKVLANIFCWVDNLEKIAF